MKKISLLFVFSLVACAVSIAQAPPGKGGKQFNAGLGFSGWGVPVYAGVDFGVHQDITIGPRVSYRNYKYRALGADWNQSLFVIGFNGNYHFNRLLDMPSEWNLYAGLTIGYLIWSDNEYTGARASGLGLDGQIGGRYFFSNKFGVNLEFGGGSGTGGGSFGITVKL
ncbi:MAG TPA: hypothetical protein PLV21_03130 [Cyclobacteriaceae bacterium]|nr:hypothetical protein [Cyclobacteriaceae bacterium]HRJ80850.1 hypothetical protein [Cyclobacteriaceae bacterium]